MKFWKLSKLLMLVAAASLFLFSCEKEKIDNADQQYPIELTVEKPGRNAILNWTKTNISDFDGYFLMSSTEPIDDALEPIGAFRVIDDFDENTFEDAFFPIDSKVYYKVYAKSGDRFLFSPTVSIEFDVTLLDMQVSEAVHNKEEELLFLFDNNLQTVFRYDLKTEEITHQVSDQNAFDFVMATGDAGMGPELFLLNTNFSNLKIYDAADLTLKESFNTNSQVQSIEVGDGVIIVASENFTNALTVFDRSTFNIIETSNVAEGFERRLGLMPGPDKVLVDCSFEQFRIYEFNDNWNITNTIAEPFFSNMLQDIVVSPDGEHFIPNLEGTVVNLEVDVVSTANTPSTNFSQDYLFSADGESLFAFNFSPGSITKFSFPNLQVLNTFDLNYNPIKAFLAKDGEVIVIGRVQSNQGTKTYVDVVEL